MLFLEKDVEVNYKAISELILLIDPTNYSYVHVCGNATEAWKKLEKAFKNSGICRRVDLLKHLCSVYHGTISTFN